MVCVCWGGDAESGKLQRALSVGHMLMLPRPQIAPLLCLLVCLLLTSACTPPTHIPLTKSPVPGWTRGASTCRQHCPRSWWRLACCPHHPSPCHRLWQASCASATPNSRCWQCRCLLWSTNVAGVFGWLFVVDGVEETGGVTHQEEQELCSHPIGCWFQVAGKCLQAKILHQPHSCCCSCYCCC